MRTATVREVRNEFSKLEGWLAEGETIEIRRRGVPVARLAPPSEPAPASPWEGVDLEKRRREISGDRLLSQQELDAIKTFELDGQEG